MREETQNLSATRKGLALQGHLLVCCYLCYFSLKDAAPDLPGPFRKSLSYQALITK